MKQAKTAPKGHKVPDRDSKGRFFSKRQLLRVIILTIAAAILAFTLWRYDIKFSERDLFCPEQVGCEPKPESSLVRSVQAIVDEREAKTVTELIVDRFGEYADQAVKVAFCESRLNRQAISHTGDYGVFQLHASTWFKVYTLDEESALLAYENIAVAYDIFKSNGYTWRAWYSSYKCHGLR